MAIDAKKRNRIALIGMGCLTVVALVFAVLFYKANTARQAAPAPSEAGMVEPPPGTAGQANNPLQRAMVEESLQEEYNQAAGSGASYVMPMTGEEGRDDSDLPSYLDDALGTMERPPDELRGMSGASGYDTFGYGYDDDAYLSRDELLNLKRSSAANLLASWQAPITVTQQYFAPPAPDQAGSGAPQAQPPWAEDAALSPPPPNVLAQAGDIYYAVLDTSLNTDHPGPVRASVKDGPFAGAVVLGNLARQGDYLQLRFNLMSTGGEEGSRGISAVAVNREYGTNLRSRVKKHYLQRFAAIMASAFLSGAGTYAELLAQEGDYVETPLTGTVRYSRGYSKDDRLIASAGRGFEQTADIVNNELRASINKPPTVELDAGTHFGLLLLNDIVEGAAREQQGAGLSGFSDGVGSGQGSPSAGQQLQDVRAWVPPASPLEGGPFDVR